MLMNYETWKCWEQFAVSGRRDTGARFDHLTATETEALESITVGTWMLEQERIPILTVENAIRDAFPDI